MAGGGPWRGRSGGGLRVRVEGRERPGVTVCYPVNSAEQPQCAVDRGEKSRSVRPSDTKNSQIKKYGLYLRTRSAVAVAGGGPWRGRSGGGGGLRVRVEGRERPGVTVCYPVHTPEQPQRAVDRGEESRTTVSEADCRE